jgi:hypothetical protein
MFLWDTDLDFVTTTGSLHAIVSLTMIATTGSLHAIVSLTMIATTGSLHAIVSLITIATTGSLHAIVSLITIATTDSLHTIVSLTTIATTGSSFVITATISSTTIATTGSSFVDFDSVAFGFPWWYRLGNARIIQRQGAAKIRCKKSVFTGEQDSMSSGAAKWSSSTRSTDKSRPRSDWAPFAS